MPNHVPEHIPLLPFTDSESEPPSAGEASEASTVEVPLDQYFAARPCPSKPTVPQFYGKQVPCFLSAVEAAVQEQQACLAETTILE